MLCMLPPEALCNLAITQDSPRFSLALFDVLFFFLGILLHLTKHRLCSLLSLALASMSASWNSRIQELTVPVEECQALCS